MHNPIHKVKNIQGSIVKHLAPTIQNSQKIKLKFQTCQSFALKNSLIPFHPCATKQPKESASILPKSIPYSSNSSMPPRHIWCFQTAPNKYRTTIKLNAKERGPTDKKPNVVLDFFILQTQTTPSRLANIPSVKKNHRWSLPFYSGQAKETCYRMSLVFQILSKGWIVIIISIIYLFIYFYCYYYLL